MMTDAFGTPQKPAFLKTRVDPPPSFAPLRRRVRAAYERAAEMGLFGLAGFKTHVVICGYPRSGTTLLQLMVETSTPNARTFGRERTAIAVARCTWPTNRPLLISKKPDDIFRVDEIRQHYRGRKTGVKFVVSVRDPRAVLTSVFVDKPGYCVPSVKWRAVYEHIEYIRRSPDVMVIEYRDVVETPTAIQEQLAGFMGCEIAAPFDRFHASVPANFDTRALNGVRPLDRNSYDKWRRPKHRERIQQILAEIPEMPQRLIELGYERDTTWTEAYR
jgi:hypothetical protein